MAPTLTKTCFVICPIGEENSTSRSWSDDIFHNLIEPIAIEFGYHARRAIDESRPGEITSNIIGDIMAADLVVADLTFHNANVFYELALRHAQAKPFLHIAESGTKIPFDISTINTVFIDRATFKSMDKTRNELRIHFAAIDDGKASFDNPVKRHHQKLQAAQTSDPLETRIYSIEEQISALSRTINQKRGGLTPLLESLEGNKFGYLNSHISRRQDIALITFILNKKFRLIFNPETNASKLIEFKADGKIGEGHNQNESTWRVENGQLEIFNSAGELFSRFIYAEGENALYHTNDPDTKSIKGQKIIPA